MKVKEIEVYLAVLAMKTDIVPSFDELKDAYRTLMHLHPDKTGPGEENNKVFQKITEAVRIVFDFLTDNPELQPKEGSAETKRMVKCFERTNKVEFKDGSLTFLYEDDQYNDWLKAFEKRIGPASKLPTPNSFIFNNKSLDIPDHPNIGTVTASLYYRPKKDGKSKILLQGTAYLEFLHFVIPDILKEDIKTKVAEHNKIETRQTSKKELENLSKVTSNSLELTSLQEKLDTTNTDEVNKKDSQKATKKTVVPQESDIQTLIKGFDKLQSAMVTLRKDLVKAVDDSCTEFEKKLEAVSSKKEIENMGKVLNSNSSELTNLQEKIEQIIANQEKMGPVDNTSLDKFISDGRTIFSKLSDITSFQMAANAPSDQVTSKNMDNRIIEELVKENKGLIAKMEEVREATDSLKKDMNEKDKALNAVVETTAKDLEKQIAAILTTVNSSPNFQPSVRPKQAKTKEPSVTAPKDNINVQEPEVAASKPEIVEVKIRNGLFMTSSIGLKLDMYDLQDRLESDITSVKTYHIECNPASKNPEMFLQQNLKKLEGEKGLDFVIICTGTNDITDLDVDNGDMSQLILKACDQSKHLVEVANEAAQRYNVDVFVVERPPRGDSNKNYSVLNDAANGLFLSLIAPLKKVHYIPLPSLHNLPEKSKKNLFTNVGVPVHLKPWGLKHLRNDIISGVKTVYDDIQAANENEDRDKITNDGKRKFQAERGSKPFLQDGKTSFHNANSSHSQAHNTKKAPENPNSFQPSGRDVSDHAGDFQPSGRIGNNDPARRGNHQQNHRGNNGGHRNNGHQQRDGYQNGDSRPAEHSFQKDGRKQEAFRRNGDDRHGDRRGDDRHGDNRQGDRNYSRDQTFRGQHRGNSGDQRRGGGQQEPQMPDMVKEYLMRTLMNNERY